jgi:hypothetical protein
LGPDARPQPNGRPQPFTRVRPIFLLERESDMHSIIYLVGLVVVVIAALSVLGLA